MRDKAAVRRGISLEVTGRCNRDCLYCYNAWRGLPHTDVPLELPTEAMKGLIRRVIVEGGRRRIDFTGGEPLLRADLPELMDTARALGATVSLTTDGGLIDADIARSLARRQVAPVQVTLLSSQRAIHDALKGGPSLDATLQGVAWLRREGVPVTAAFVCTRANAEELAGVAELCVAMDISALVFNRLCTVGRAAREVARLAVGPEVIAARLREIEGLKQAWPELRFYNGLSIPTCTLRGAANAANAGVTLPAGTGSCGASGGDPAWAVGHLGGLRACTSLPTEVANLTRHTWDEAMARAAEASVHSRPVPAACAGCADLAACRGGCVASMGAPGQADPLATRD